MRTVSIQGFSGEQMLKSCHSRLPLRHTTRLQWALVAGGTPEDPTSCMNELFWPGWVFTHHERRRKPTYVAAPLGIPREAVGRQVWRVLAGQFVPKVGQALLQARVKRHVELLQDLKL